VKKYFFVVEPILFLRRIPVLIFVFSVEMLLLGSDKEAAGRKLEREINRHLRASTASRRAKYGSPSQY